MSRSSGKPKSVPASAPAKAASQKPKKDTIVSVRLPKGLVDELRDIQEVNHFMDLSDEIRFVVRRYCLSFLNSQGQSQSIDALAEQKRKEKLILDLTRIIDTLKSNQSQDISKAANPGARPEERSS